jgi:hypothetical protein
MARPGPVVIPLVAGTEEQPAATVLGETGLRDHP